MSETDNPVLDPPRTNNEPIAGAKGGDEQARKNLAELLMRIIETNEGDQAIESRSEEADSSSDALRDIDAKLNSILEPQPKPIPMLTQVAEKPVYEFPTPPPDVFATRKSSSEPDLSQADSLEALAQELQKHSRQIMDELIERHLRQIRNELTQRTETLRKQLLREAFDSQNL